MSESGNRQSIQLIHEPRFHDDTFQERLRRYFREAPWLLVSLIIHIAAGLLIANIDWQTLRTDADRILICKYDPEELEHPLQEEPEDLKEPMDQPPEEPEPPVPLDTVPQEPFVSDLLDPPIDNTPAVNNFRPVIGTGGGGGPRGRGLRRLKGATGRSGQATQRAVDWGLKWLARHQDPEGFWDCDSFHMQCEENRCDGRGEALNDVGVTGLALLAFLGVGDTPRSGEHRDTIRRAVRYLCDVQDPEDGCLTPKESNHYMYNHAIACLALTEAYGLSRWVYLKGPAAKALEFVHRSKNPGKAWRYNLGDEIDPMERNDVSVTGWMVMCLASAKDAGLPIHNGDVEDALLYIDEMTDTATGRTGYRERGSYSSREQGDELLWPFEKVEPMTGVGMFCRVLCAGILNDGELDDHNEKMCAAGAALLRDALPKWSPDEGTIDYYYWYYGSYAMFQMAGQDWRLWKQHLVEALVESQQMEGCGKGSWDPQRDPWGESGGRVYATALSTLCLEVFYRYDHILGPRVR